MQLQIDFGSGFTTYDIISNSLKKSEILHNNLKNADSTLSFTLAPEEGLYNLLRTTSSPSAEIPLQLLDNNNDIAFSGYLRKTYSFEKIKAMQPLKCEGVTGSYLLKRKVGYTLSYTNIPASTLLANLLTTAGLNPTKIHLPVITTTIPAFNVIAGDGDTYHTYIEDILFEFGFVFYFDKNGDFQTYNLFPTTLEPVRTYNDANTFEGIRQNVRQEDKEQIIVKWHSVISKDITLFANASVPISIAPNSYFGGEETDTHEWWADYDSDLGTVLSASNVTSDFAYDYGIEVQTFTPYAKRALLKIKNTNTVVAKNITRFQIKGTAQIQLEGENKSIVTKNSNTEKIETYDAKYIFYKTTADHLANGLAWWYKYTDFESVLSSRVESNIGDIVSVVISGMGTTIGRVIRKTTNYQYGESNYLCDYIVEAVQEYLPDEVVGESTYSQPASSEVVESIKSIVDAGLNLDGTLAQPINSNTMITDLTPTGDGLYLTKDKMGLFYGGVWRSYIQSNGTFGFMGDSSNYMQWNGTKLVVKGDLEITGGISLNGTVSVGDAISSSNYSAGLAGWKILGDGNAELNNVTVRGTIVASAGSIAGTTITSTKLYQGTGTFNSADTSFYLDNAGQLSLKDKLSWNGTALSLNGSLTTTNLTATGGTIAGLTIGSAKLYYGAGNYNNADTPFFVSTDGLFSLKDKLVFDGTNLTVNGIVNATSGSFTGAVNATSGSFTGSITSSNITATGGTIAGWLIGADKLTSAATGSILELNKTLSRISVKTDSTTKVAMGYLEGLSKASGGTYAANEYGFWAAPGEKITFDGLVDINGNAVSVIDGALNISINTVNGVKNIASVGTISGATGMHYFNQNNSLTRSSLVSSAYSTDSGTGASTIGFSAIRNGVLTGTLALGFNTTDGTYYEPTLSINDPIKITAGANVNGDITTLGTYYHKGNIKATWLEFANNQVFLDGTQFVYPWQTTTAVPSYVLVESTDNASWPSGSGKLTKKKTIPSYVWTLDHSTHDNKSYLDAINQALATTSNVTFNKITLTSTNATSSDLASKKIMYREIDGTVCESTLPVDVCSTTKVDSWNTAYTNNHTHSNKTTLDGINQALATTSNPTFVNLTATQVRSSSVGRSDDTDLISMPSANNVTINGNLSLTGTAKPNGSSYTVRGTNISTSAPTTEGIDGDMWIQV